jgi:hypothetical protein
MDMGMKLYGGIPAIPAIPAIPGIIGMGPEGMAKPGPGG